MAKEVALDDQSVDRGDDQLHLFVEYRLRPPAREASLIIDRLGNAWSQIGQAGQPTTDQLYIDRIEISSLHAWFELGAAATAIADSRGILIQFVQNLAVAAQTLINAGLQEVPPSVRTFLAALARPVASRAAESAGVHVHGDNTTIIVINEAQAVSILTAVGESSSAQLLTTSESRPGGSSFHGVDQYENKYGPRIVTQRTLGPRPSRARIQRAILVNAGREIFAKVEGFGILIPAVGVSEPFDQQREVMGRIVRRAGIPAEFQVTGAVE